MLSRAFPGLALCWLYGPGYDDAVRAGVLVYFLERRGQRAASRRSSKHARDAVAGTPQAVPKILVGLKQLQSTDDSAAGTVQHVQRAGAVRWARVWVDEGVRVRMGVRWVCACVCA